MRKIILGTLFITFILWGNSVVQAQQSSEKITTCQPPAEEIISVVKSLSDFSSSPQKVWLIGEIRSSGRELSIPEKQLPLTQAIAMVGGLLKTANGSVYIIKQFSGDQTKTRIEININDIKKGIVKDINLEKGDLVFVSRGCVDGKLLSPSIFKHPGLTLTDAPTQPKKYQIYE